MASLSIDSSLGKGLRISTYGSVPLMIAARMGHIKTVQRLLELGADVNCKEKLGPTALHFAAEDGHSEVVKLLLRAGATDTPDQDGKRAVDKARAI
ncbi:Ankyrin repeat domain-containing protein 29 [Geodia barretti]|uniref:Ankyrin repeat domain-containing protein 29 n=1 Tax=Geodia barretti TaxID=519541 RepID=A0AA35WMI2_GEOBA|nr:Ankyrin repeat domain-containing protein 29 [Geodia barretti]